jgi:malate synthase
VTIVESIAIDQTTGEITDARVQTNVVIGLRYVASWLAHGSMEDATTAEIARAQLCDWATHHVRTTTGALVDADHIRHVVRRELDLLTCGLGSATKARFERAAELFTDVALTESFTGFLTLAAHEPLPAHLHGQQFQKGSTP